MKFHYYSLSLLLSLWGCASRSQAPASTPAPPISAPETVATFSPIELTADEELVMAGLKRHIDYLSGKIGERNASSSWELADAADYLALELEAMGYPLERQGYETADVAAQNLSVTVSGGSRGDQVLIVGAHYDSPLGDTGRNAGATGTAAIVELARLMRDAKLQRTLRFVLFSMGESPDGDAEARGARHFSRMLVKSAPQGADSGSPVPPAPVSQVEIMGLLHLDRLGVLDSRRRADSRVQSWVQMAASPRAGAVAKPIAELLNTDRIGVESLKFDEFLVGRRDSDARAFYSQGIPVVAVSGYSEAKGPEAKVDLSELARVVMRLRAGIGQIVGELPTNDGMLTPHGVVIR